MTSLFSRYYAVAAAVVLVAAAACDKASGTGWKPSDLPDDPEITNPVDGKIHTWKAPMTWSVYEYCREAEKNSPGRAIDMTDHEWDRMIDWVAENLLPYGYNMIETDGFMSMTSDNSEESKGYMTHYGSISLKKLVEKCSAKGLKLMVYDNPLWIHGDDALYIDGTGYKIGGLRYNSSDKVLYPGKSDSFPWAVPSHKGCREFIDGFFKYYKSLGIEYIRMDFMCLFETGDGAGGMPGRGYGREEYELALKYICESAQKYGVFTSIVMPNLKENGALELQYCNMYRFSADTFDGGWGHVSSWLRGEFRPGTWPTTNNIFDGYTKWAWAAGKDKAIPDGDFIRLNTMADENECKSEISLHLMAGGPLQASDRPEMIAQTDNWLRFYQNEEMLALNKDRFVGKPLSDDIGSERSQIWCGQMSDGSYVLALFNREDDTRNRYVHFSDLGIDGDMNVRDLWERRDEGRMRELSVEVPRHGVKVVRLTK